MRDPETFRQVTVEEFVQAGGLFLSTPPFQEKEERRAIYDAVDTLRVGAVKELGLSEREWDALRINGKVQEYILPILSWKLKVPTGKEQGRPIAPESK